MEYAEHLNAVEQEVAGLVAAIGAGPLDQPVPTCPGWDVAALTDHVGGFAEVWAHVLCEGTGRPKPPFEERPADADPVTAAKWFATAGGHLVEALASAGPATRAWTWAPDRQDAAFVARRCAHELAIHRYDAESARGDAHAIPGGLAIDGIDEIFALIDAWASLGSPPEDRGTGRGNGETLHLHATDTEAEWLVELAPAGIAVRREHAKGDLALRGAVSDLELVLYERPALGTLERFGDEAVLDAWRRAFRFT